MALNNWRNTELSVCFTSTERALRISEMAFRSWLYSSSGCVIAALSYSMVHCKHIIISIIPIRFTLINHRTSNVEHWTFNITLLNYYIPDYVLKYKRVLIQFYQTALKYIEKPYTSLSFLPSPKGEGSGVRSDEVGEGARRVDDEGEKNWLQDIIRNWDKILIV